MQRRVMSLVMLAPWASPVAYAASGFIAQLNPTVLSWYAEVMLLRARRRRRKANHLLALGSNSQNRAWTARHGALSIGTS